MSKKADIYKEGTKYLLDNFDELFSLLYAYYSRRLATKKEIHSLLQQTLKNINKSHFSEKEVGISWECFFYKRAYENFKTYQINTSQKFKKHMIEEEKGTFFSYQDNFIRDLFREISDFEAELVRLKYFEKLTNIEIAYILGLTTSEVGVDLYRVMKKAQNLLYQY